MKNLLWGARLLYVERASPDPRALATWYARVLGDALSAAGSDAFAVRGPSRALLFSKGAAKTAPSYGFSFDTHAQWRDYRLALEKNSLEVLEIAPQVRSFLGDTDAYAVRDLEDRAIVFTYAREHDKRGLVSDAKPLPARLQHFVTASTKTPAMLDFYRDVLGFAESDRVVDDNGDLSAAFVRSDPEHHSFAVFRAPQAGPDHHAYEVPSWNGIRDWADHCGSLEIPLWWGPGRHGVGNNLFFMIEDPEGYKVEFSAELEIMTADQDFRTWPHGQRALNLWGNAWMRS